MAGGVSGTQDQGFSVGRVFSRAFGTIAANPLAALGIALLFGALPSAACTFAGEALSSSSSALFVLSLIVLLRQMLIGSVCGALANGAFVGLTVAHDAGRRPGFVEASAAGARELLPLIALGLIMGLGITLGILAVIVPGIILTLIWMVAAPTLVDQRCGVIAALGRSRKLTDGAWGAIFTISIVLAVGAGLLTYLLTRLTSGLAVSGLGFGGMGALAFHIAHTSVELVIGMIATAFSAAIYTSIYVELKNWKYGTPEAALAEIFA